MAASHVHRVPDAGLTELGSGIDSLYLSGRAALPEAFLSDLEASKRQAMEAGEPIGFILDGEEPVPAVSENRRSMKQVPGGG